jgi:ABC-2 type transport system ATP-binding protein
MALLFRDRGSASIKGLDCWQQSVAVKRLVGYLPGELAIDANLTGGQILAYFANLRGGVDEVDLKQLISCLDLDVSQRFRHYSHGNRQKVGLIQAFMHRPPLLILDEPTSGLDPLNQQEFAPWDCSPSPPLRPSPRSASRARTSGDTHNFEVRSSKSKSEVGGLS